MADNEEYIYVAEIMKTIADLDYMRDITLVAGVDGERIRVHRVVMAAASKYLKSLFGPKFEDYRYDEIVFNEIDGSTLKIIIDFCYTGRIALTEANVNEVLAAATSMELPKLEQKCREFWDINLSNGHLVSTLLHAEKYKLKDLRKKSIKAVCGNFENIPIEELQKIDGNILCEILSSDVVAANETFIFDRLMLWLGEHEIDKAEFASKLLTSIRLEHIPAEVLREKVEPVFEENGCMKLVVDEYRDRLFDVRLRSLYRNCKYNIFYGYYDRSRTAIVLLKYHLSNNTWTEFRSFAALTPRWSFVNGDLFVFQGRPCKKIEAYNLSAPGQDVVPPMRELRSDFKTIVVGKHLYVFGRNSYQCERFNTELRVWESISPSPTTGHADYTITESNGTIYFQQFVKYSLLRYNTNEDKWSETSEIIADLDDKRFNMNAIQTIFKAKAHIYVITAQDSLYKYNAGLDSWTKLRSNVPNIKFFWTTKYFGTTYGFTSSGFGIVTPEDEYIFHQLYDLPVYDGINAPFLAYTK